MNDLKILLAYFKEDKLAAVVTGVSAVIGAILGVIAFYNGWLG